MRPFHAMSIRYKIMLISIGTSGIALVLAGGALGINDWLSGKRILFDRLSTQASIIGTNSAAALVFNDRQSATETLSALSAEPPIVAAGIYLLDKSLFAGYPNIIANEGLLPLTLTEEHQRQHTDNLHVFQPIFLDGEQIGMVYLRADLRDLYSQLHSHSGIIALVLFLSLLIAVIFSSVMQRLISDPLRRLTIVANAVSKEKQYALRVEKPGEDELGILTAAFNEMLAQIQKRDQSLKQHKIHLETLVSLRTEELSTLNRKLKHQTMQLEEQVRKRTAELHGLNEQLKHQAYHDTLTNLPNRALLNDRLGQAILHARRSGQRLAVLFLDLDRFKYINDTLGHAVGDQLLRLVAGRLSKGVRKNDTVARLGGDEFTVLLNAIIHSQDAGEIAGKIIKSLEQPFDCYGHELHVTTSIGIAVSPEHGDDAETLMRNADTAMYGAKTQGRNNYRLYAADMHADSLRRLETENSLRQAMIREDFVLHYQPLCDINSGQVVALEALIRWKHQDRGLICPEAFIGILEETGLIVPVGEWVLRNACTQTKTWRDKGAIPVNLSVNVSPRQFNQQNLAEKILQILIHSGIPPETLTLEITEGVLMENAENTIKTLQELNTMGVHLAIDDFGTGYSSLSYLKRFPIDSIKIDKSFIRDIASDPDDAAIVRAIIAMAHALGMQVIAEGVETKHQLDFLRSYHCDVAQGYLFNRPLPLTELDAKLFRVEQMG